MKGIVFKGNKVSFACILPAFTSEIENTVLYTLDTLERLPAFVHVHSLFCILTSLSFSKSSAEIT